MATIRNMTADELVTLVEWAAAEGWNPGLHDAACFWNADPDGYLAIELNGKFIGGGAIVRHGESFGFMGLFIVEPPYRGKGLGTQLWFARRDRLLSRLKPGGTIGLDAVDAMIPFYEAGGFRQFARQRRYSFQGQLAAPVVSMPIGDLRAVDYSAVLEYDRECFPEARTTFLSDWINQDHAISRGVFDHDKLQGFGVMRRCVVGWKIGPLFADSLEIADVLFQALVSEAAGLPVFLDAPDYNPAAIELCRRRHMTEVFGCVRMYLGPEPQLDNQRVFGITTFEIG